MNALLLILAVSSPVKIDSPPCSYVVPEGFEELPPPPGTLHVYRRFIGPDPLDATLFSVEAMRGTIGRDLITPAELEAMRARMPVNLGHAPWKGFTLETFEMRLEKEGHQMFSIATQVPLEPVALQLDFAAPIGLEAELRKDQARVLASLEGKSTWLTEGERVEALAEGTWKMGRTLGALAALVIAATLAMLIVRRQTAAGRPKG
jgi:hypothetical protein